MVKKAGKILIVDDSPEDVRMLLEQLKHEFAVTAAMTAEEGLDSLSDHTPDLIILDVSLPDKSGYELCEQIKARSDTQDIEVIFLSSNDSTDEILKGYEAGAIDYIVKPYMPEVLNSKIKKALEAHNKRLSLSNAADSAVKVAMTAMSDSGDLGLVVKFMKSAFAAKNVDQLTENVVAFLKDFQLEGSVLLKRTGIESICSTAGEAPELEVELLRRLHGHSKPLIEKGPRLFACEDNAVVIVKRLPEDADRAGRIKDYILMMTSGANARLNSIADALKTDVRREVSIQNVIKNAEESLRDIQQMQGDYKKKSMVILDEMVHDVEKSFFPMALTDDQEKQLLALLHSGVERALDHFEKGIHMDEKVKEIILALSEISDSFH